MFEILGYRCQCLMPNTHNKWSLNGFRKTCCLCDVVVSRRNPDISMGMAQFCTLSAINFCHNPLNFYHVSCSIFVDLFGVAILGCVIYSYVIRGCVEDLVSVIKYILKL